MPFIDPNADARQAQAVAAIPVGRPGVVVDGRLHPYASIGSRILATTIDLIVYRVGLMLVLVLCGFLLLLTSLGGKGTDGTSLPALAICVVYIALCFGPLTFRGHGQSVGKRMLGIRVLHEDGTPAAFGRVLLRETPWRALPLIVLPIQAAPSVFDVGLAAVGIIVALLATANPGRQTFYDRLAHTVVVEENPVPLEP